MSELLIFPDQHLGEHRRPQNVTAKQKVTRTIGACLFAIGTTIGLKYGFDAITENQTGTELVASA
ncbi:MAG TPA: hypothetical protein VLA92_00255, partial [Candidatus Saccharimonadales bacterium]|nr:hypothetical protein [Candidatus Saccharimonadales bacterium]